MPIPTDTFWNIRRLNLVFAISSVLMIAVCFWAVKQDYDKAWRPLQQNGRVWEAALTEEKIGRLDTKQVEEQVKALNDKIDAKQKELEEKDAEYKKAKGEAATAEGTIANLSFEYNNLKATVAVLESNLQDAKTRGDKEQITAITKELERADRAPKVAQQAEALAAQKTAAAESRAKIALRARELDDLKKQKKALYDTIESLRKKVNALVPQTGAAKLSEAIRSAPLLQFLNPADRVKPTFLPDIRMDVSFTTIDTIDRCATCHVHIENKAFTREKMAAYLEEELAGSSARKYRYIAPEKAKAVDPIETRPMATAMPEFWHYWGRKLLTPASLVKAQGKINGVFNVIGPKLDVRFENKKVAETKYPTTALSNPAALSAKEQAHYDGIFIAAVNALYRANPDDAALTTARNLAFAYPIQMQQLLKAELAPEEYKQLEDRYRSAMIAEINPIRAKLGYKPLDPSPAQLAHPRLDLYVDTDSKHPMEGIGCTSCHDGSGNETDFVLAAHAPRAIWVDDKTGEPVLPAQLKNAKAESETPKLDNMLAAVYPGSDVIPVGVPSLHLEFGKDEKKSDKKEASIGRERPKEEVAENAPATDYVDPVNGKSGRAVPQGRYWAQKYEPDSGTSFEMVNELWDFPMRPPEYLQANCARCHNNFHDIREEAPVLYEGRSLFNKLGCVNCHQMDSVAPDEQEAKNLLPDGSLDIVRRRVGTDLRHVSSKLSKDFVSTWIWAPKAFRPSTLMPHFFMLENSSSDEEIRRTRQEVKAITEYLFEASTPLAPSHLIGPALSGSPDKGRLIFQNIGCQGCHSNLNETGEQWITTDLVKRFAVKKDDAQKQYDEMTYNQRQVYALENLGEVTSTGNDQKKYADGSAMPVFMHHAPELSGVGDKLTAGRTPEQARAWLFDWLKEPRHYSAYTVMPRLRLNDQQAIDLVEYLLSQHRMTAAPKGADPAKFDDWKASQIPADQKKIDELVAFFLRSQYSTNTADLKAKDAAEIKSRAIDALTFVSTATDEPRGADDVKAKAEAKAIATERVEKMLPQERQLVFLGSKLISHYGCFNCHAINGMESVASPCANLSDWGEKQVSKLDFGYLDEHKIHSLPEKRQIPMVNGLSPASVTEIAEIADNRQWTTPIAANVDVAWPHVEHTRTAWLTQKLLNTRVYDRGKNGLDPVRKTQDGKPVLEGGDPVLDQLAGNELRGKPYDKLKMPTFYLDEHQAHALTTFVISNRRRLVSDKLLDKVNNDAAKQIAHGRQVAERYNCVGCHQVELNFPAVRQYYEQDLWNDLAPPSLRGEGNKIQHAWLFEFLKNVEPIRPLLYMRAQKEGKEGIRMPSFPLTDEETTAVAAYFAAVSNREARSLHQNLDNIVKSVELKRKATTQPITDPENVWPGDEWVENDINAQPRDYLRNWVVDRKLMLESAFDPAKTKPEDQKIKYREALFKARFVMDLFDAPYPFVESAQPDKSDAAAFDVRFKKGESFFYDLQCLKCHVLGDQNAAGANNNPTAPNLSLAYRRLQRRWVGHWVQEPYIIQINTKMPAFFSGLPVFNLEGQPWPLAQGGTPEDTAKVLAKYGLKDVKDQKSLVLDFLYAAGARGYTGVQPATPDVKPEAKPAEAPKAVDAPAP